GWIIQGLGDGCSAPGCRARHHVTGDRHAAITVRRAPGDTDLSVARRGRDTDRSPGNGACRDGSAVEVVGVGAGAGRVAGAVTREGGAAAERSAGVDEQRTALAQPVVSADGLSADAAGS